MITDYNDFLSQLKEIENGTSETMSINPSNEPRVYIDADKRIVDSNNVLSNFVTVVLDHNAETIYFEMDRYFDDADLSTKNCIIKFQNIKAELDFDAAVDRYMDTVDGKEKIVFGWQISSKATKYSGDLVFQIMFYSLNDNDNFDYVLSTKTATLPIQNGIGFVDVVSNI